MTRRERGGGREVEGSGRARSRKSGEKKQHIINLLIKALFVIRSEFHVWWREGKGDEEGKGRWVMEM